MQAKILQFPRPTYPYHSAPEQARLPYELRPEAIAQALQRGQCPEDREFDAFLPNALRILSRQHWTPLAVVARAARWFGELGVSSVLDIGSGAGKFCVAAALAGRCHFVGLEHRPELVSAARALARSFGVDDRVQFISGALGDVVAPNAELYYLFNPFEENLSQGSEYIARDVELSSARYARDLAATQQLFRTAPLGTYVLTYNGFGASLPSGYRELRPEPDVPSPLRLFRKTRGRYFQLSSADSEQVERSP
jgi:SAM-dependent methyltransferase